MKEWCLTHYWMTFWIIMSLIYVVSIIVNNILIIIHEKNKTKELNNK